MTRVFVPVATLSLAISALQAQTFSDDFNDNSRDPALWEEMFSDPDNIGTGQLLEQTERVEFTTDGNGDTDVSQALRQYPSYDQAWQVQMVVSMGPANFTDVGDVGTVSIDVGAGDHWLGMGYGAGVLRPGPAGTALISGWSVGTGQDQNITELALPDAIGIRIVYDPLRRLIQTYYDLDADMTDGEWTPYESFTIDGSPNPIGTVNLNWGMTASDTFYIAIDGFSSGPAIAAGSAWADDFEFHLGSTVRNEPGVGIFDDFNDDSRDPIWSEPTALQDGAPLLVETSHRLEFQLPDPGARNDILQSIEPDLAPRFDQAWEVKVETRLAPGGWSTEGEGGSLAIQIEPAGESFSRIRLARGAFHDGAQLHPVIVVNGEEQEVEFQFPAEIEPSVLPDIVGLRVAWDPGSKILSSYIDTDGDATIESWTLFSTFTLDGSDQGADGSIDFQMQPTDTFRISLLAGADADDGPGNPVVEPGEAYFDNFTLIGESPATGYDLWAAQIPDEANRGPEDYFSGYPLPNVLRYMYGLDPTEDDPSVDLKIELQDGVPVLLHGLNESAQDYDFAYQWKANLTDPWTWASEDDATSVETVSTGGKTYRKITFPLEQEGRFVRLGVAPR